jgi:hypothetical protein
MSVTYVAMTSIAMRMLDRELKKGSAELIILSIVEPRARHGYEISKLIETRSAGKLKFHVASHVGVAQSIRPDHSSLDFPRPPPICSYQ